MRSEGRDGRAAGAAAAGRRGWRDGEAGRERPRPGTPRPAPPPQPGRSARIGPGSARRGAWARPRAHRVERGGLAGCPGWREGTDRIRGQARVLVRRPRPLQLTPAAARARPRRRQAGVGHAEGGARAGGRGRPAAAAVGGHVDVVSGLSGRRRATGGLHCSCGRGTMRGMRQHSAAATSVVPCLQQASGCARDRECRRCVSSRRRRRRTTAGHTSLCGGLVVRGGDRADGATGTDRRPPRLPQPASLLSCRRRPCRR